MGITTMNLFFELKINDKNSLMFFIPSNVEEKLNYLFYPTETINLFDEIMVVLKTDETALELTQDSIEFTIGRLYRSLKDIFELPSMYTVGDVARLYNIDFYHEILEMCDLSESSLWNNQHTMTFLYSQYGKIYLDISPRYPWLSQELEEAKESNDFFPFEDYIRNYKPIKIYELSQETIDQWRAQCSQFLKRVEKPTGLKDYDND